MGKVEEKEASNIDVCCVLQNLVIV